MAVYYKFKSAKDYDSIAMDGPFISVMTLKEKIFESKHLGRGTDFDLVVTNAQSNEEYLDDAMLIPKNTSVLIRRVPGRPRMPIVTDPIPKVEETVHIEQVKTTLPVVDSSATKHNDDCDWDDLGSDLYEIPDSARAQSNNVVIEEAPSTNMVDEESKIKALIDTPALDWQRQGDGFGHGRGFGRGMGGRMMSGRGFGRGGVLERKTPPQGYVCHRCKVPGHFIQHCNTNGDPNYDIKRVKPPTGIPKSMLMASTDGSYALPSGAVAVLRPNEAAFEREVEGLPSTRSVGDLPPELHCPLCKEVMKHAVLTSKCCFTSFCDKCIRDYFISKSMCVCGATNILADDLLPNKTLRDTINRILESGNSSADNAGSTYQVQDMESARPKAPSPVMSAVSKEEEKSLHEPEIEDESKVQEPLEEAKPVIDDAPQAQAENVIMTKIPDVSEATHDSMSVKEPASQGSTPLVEEEVQQLSSLDAAKKKKKKKIRMPGNDMHWKGHQELPVDNYMMNMNMNMNMGPSPYNNPYWQGGMQPGMEGYMGPYGAPMPYMPYNMGPMDMPFPGFMPQDPYAQGFMFPGVPPQRDLADFNMNGMNRPPPVMSREEFEARKADMRRKREMERRNESREFPKDRDFSRDVANGPLKPKSKPSERPSSPNNHHHHRRHRPERSSVDRSQRDFDPPRPPKRNVDHDYDHNHSRENLDLHQHHHRRRHAEPSARQPSESSGRQISEPSGKAPAGETAAEALERKRKQSVFSRISFPEGESSKKQKVASSSAETAATDGAPTAPVEAHHHRHHKAAPAPVTNGTVTSGGGGRRTHSLDYESSDDDRHFKRKPSRYEPSPPPPAAEPEEPKRSRGSRERSKHR